MIHGLGPSWSVISYDHSEKGAYEVVQNMYSPQVAIVDTTGGEVNIWAVSDSPEKVEASLKIEVQKNERIVFKKSIPVDLEFMSSKKVYELTYADLPAKKDLVQTSIVFILKDRNTGDILFQDNFYFGLSPEERITLGGS